MKTSRSKGEPPTEDRNIPAGTYVTEGRKGSARGSRFESEFDHGGFRGVVSHGIPDLVNAPDFSSHERRRGLANRCLREVGVKYCGFLPALKLPLRRFPAYVG